MRKLEILSGAKFGRLTVVEEKEEYILPSGQKHRKFLCQCECGKQLTIRLSRLRSKDTRSCGCLQLELVTRHGFHGSALYRCCLGAIGRCHNPNNPKFLRYGGRGIKVFSAWRKNIGGFVRYLEQLPGAGDPLLSMDRIDNDGNYEPGNLRFVTNATQIRNQKIKGKVPFRGVSEQGSRYKAQIEKDGTKYLGTFDTPEEASEAYQKALHEILDAENASGLPKDSV